MGSQFFSQQDNHWHINALWYSQLNGYVLTTEKHGIMNNHMDLSETKSYITYQGMQYLMFHGRQDLFGVVMVQGCRDKVWTDTDVSRHWSVQGVL